MIQASRCLIRRKDIGKGLKQPKFVIRNQVSWLILLKGSFKEGKGFGADLSCGPMMAMNAYTLLVRICFIVILK